MPNWKTHLEISNRINKGYGFEGMELKKFLLGSILPDINNSHVVENISVEIKNEITHFYQKDKPSYIVFYEKYREQIDKKDPLFIGYITHLYTDYTWNNGFYTKLKKENYPETDRDTLRKMKWNDFAVFNNKFMELCIDIYLDDEVESIYNNCKNIKEINVSERDIRLSIEFLKKKIFYEADVQFYTIKELDELLEKTVESLSKK